MSSLKIIKASAGSGKTFRLTREYLELLMVNPGSYRNILAVTFTNKATAEMKTRILGELYNLSRGKNSGHAIHLQQVANLDEEKLKKRATTALNLILHNYSSFSIGTIDKFFQKVLRGFARETGLQSIFRIELNQNLVLSKTIDELLFRLDEFPGIKIWLARYADERIKSGKSWNFRKNLNSMGKEIFRENFKLFDKEIREKLFDKEFLNMFREKVHKEKETIEERYRALGKKAMGLIANTSLEVDDFPRKGSGYVGFLMKSSRGIVPESYKMFHGAIDDPGKWATKSSKKKEEIIRLMEDGLLETMKELWATHEENHNLYTSCNLVLSNLYALGILSDISKILHEYTNENNLFLLSDAARLLNKIIDTNEAPFIYEKTGTIYNHYMMDEFQDTSTLQWQNFRPLIRESLSSGNRCLVVGDVKQSIYRWRNSDWNILAEELEAQFKSLGTEIENLRDNYRSNKNIIAFNNAFFSSAIQQLVHFFNEKFTDTAAPDEFREELVQKMVNAYSDILQITPENRDNDGGYVQCKIFEKPEDKDAGTPAWDELTRTIKTLLETGNQYRDIAILARSNKEGKEIAEFLFNKKQDKNLGLPENLDIISDDAITLSSSPAIKLLTACLRYMTDPSDDISLSRVQNEYFYYILDTNDTRHLVPGENQGMKPPEVFGKRLDSLKNLPLYEMVEEIIELFGLNKMNGQLLHVQSFLDQVLGFSVDGPADLYSFLQWWDENGESLSVNIPEEQNAIRIFTIHKAKGLEFKSVIVPFADFPFRPRGDTDDYLWCTSMEHPFDEIPKIPVGLNSKMGKSYFFREYFLEEMQNHVDNINLLYVAFTRARENLFVTSTRKNKPNSTSTTADASKLLYETLSKGRGGDVSAPSIDLSTFFNPEEGIFQYGELSTKTEDVRLPGNTLHISTIPAGKTPSGTRFKLNSLDYFDIGGSKTGKHADHGKVMHLLFESIITKDDIAKATDKMVFEGKITREEKPEIINTLQECLADDRVKEWYSGRYRVKTEAEILLKNGDVSRPDRVMVEREKAIVVDYKFGEIPGKHYTRQVRNYMHYLKKMGYDEVEGYLWFPLKKEIIPVNN
jgi:ATP-dependent exoDNAse (exonuclease V) beta subunit